MSSGIIATSPEFDTFLTKRRTGFLKPEPAAEDGFELINPQYYGTKGCPHELWTRLRRDGSLHRFEPPDYPPFWAVTKHAHVCEISKQPTRFLNGHGPNLLRYEPGLKPAAQRVLRKTLDRALPSSVIEALRQMRGHGSREESSTLIAMDPPEHRVYRKIASPYFTRRALRHLDAEIAESARRLVDEIAGDGAEGRCDFATRIAATHPLAIIAGILGVPREDRELILRLSNEIFGLDDPEYRRSEDRHESIAKTREEFFAYFSKIIEDRRAQPRDDLASVISNARIDGEPMSRSATLGYFLIMFTAGHETTRNAISGGMLALAENPGELERLRRTPSLLPKAIEEMVRWTSPVNYMARTAAEDCELHGRKIRRGDRLALFYGSANRDEDVFEDPFVFRVDRHPNPHLGFGIGEHFCLGADLARKTSGGLFKELIPRLESVELAGRPERVASSFVTGIKHLPIRYRIAPTR